MLFEWDERKREANLAKHRIDFEDARMVFDGPVTYCSGLCNARATATDRFSKEGTSA